MNHRLGAVPPLLPVIGFALLAVVNVLMLSVTDWTMLRGGAGADWSIFVEASRRLAAGGLYAVEDNYAFRYSPVFAQLFGIVAFVGPLAWRIFHLAAAASTFVRSPWLAMVILTSWPFWFDVEAGNIMTFVAVLAVFALGGKGWATGGFLAVLLLAPRPLMLPVAGWLLWKQPRWRLPFVVMFAIHAAAVALTGLGPSWLAALAASGAEIGSALNFGPSRLIGVAWIPIGIAVGAYLTLRGRVGLAALAVSPYWLPYYFLMPLVDLRPREGERPAGAADRQ